MASRSEPRSLSIPSSDLSHSSEMSAAGFLASSDLTGSSHAHAALALMMEHVPAIMTLVSLDDGRVLFQVSERASGGTKRA